MNNIKKVKYLFDSVDEMRLFKESYFKNIENQELILIGQSPKLKELIFITCARSINNITTSNAPKRIEVDNNYYQPNWDFLPKDDQLYLIYKLLINGLAKFINKVDYWAKDSTVQNFLVAQLLNSLCSLNQLGITHGYLSLLSNRNYFLSQINVVFSNSDVNKICKSIYTLNDRELDQIYDKPKIDDEFLKTLFNITEKIDRKFYINKDALSNPEHFFDSDYKMEYSKFHKTFLTNPVLLHNYKSKQFYIYRFLMSIIFRLLPVLDISLLRRNHILQLCILNIETYFNITWESQYYESVYYYKKRWGFNVSKK
ncbi:hypothetical protein [Limosilactobacillus reuteri]|uniref:hypothetical protein n=1 Tax=Limosilactobacillus reuteri TaxID=1598 RepID=UPI0011C49A81|nr:hypothetical protein [Limosilactobacillus reuteri]